jgi:hypothetical protein
MRIFVLISSLFVFILLTFAQDSASRSRYVIAHVTTLDSQTGVAELRVSPDHGIDVGERAHLQSDTREDLEAEVLSVGPLSTSVRFLGGRHRILSEGDQLTLYYSPKSATKTTTPDKLPPPKAANPILSVTGAASSEIQDMEFYLKQVEIEMELMKAEILLAEMTKPQTAKQLSRPLSWKGYVRAGFELRRNVNYSPLGIDTSDPNKAMDDLNELIDQAAIAVEDSGSVEARDLLDDAIELRDEAAILLDSDPDLAILLIELAAFSASEAIALAGGVAPPSASEREVEKPASGFVENYNIWNVRSASGTNLTITNRLRATDDYVRDSLDFKLSRSGDAGGWGLRPGIELKDYKPNRSDDRTIIHLDGEVYRNFPGKNLRLTLGERLYYSEEYNGNGDDGYLTLQGYVAGRYGLDLGQSTSLRYTFAQQRYNEADNSDFDYNTHRLRMEFEKYGDKAEVMLLLEGSYRDYNQPEDRDDYWQLQFQNRAGYRFNKRFRLGYDGTYTYNTYEETGDDNSDYLIADGRLGLEYTLTERLTLSAESGLYVVRYDDRNSHDSYDKKQGDYTEYRNRAQLTYSPRPSWYLIFEAGLDRHVYRYGETGNFETFLSADFSPIADFDREYMSAVLRGDLTDSIALYMNCSIDRDIFETYDQYDGSRETFQLQLTWRY